MSDVKYCPKCGAELTDSTAKKCESCGYVLKKKNSTNTVLLVIIIVFIVFGSLPILGIVAALTIPTLVNRQSDVAAKVKIKKSIYTYANIMSIYTLENDKKNLSGAFGKNCENSGEYFHVIEGSGCNFTTPDGVYWELDPDTGYAAISDNKENPQYSIVMWNGQGSVNDENNKPANLKYPSVKPQKGVYTAYEFMTKYGN